MSVANIFMIVIGAFFLCSCSTVDFADRRIDGCSPSTYASEGPLTSVLITEEQQKILDYFSSFAIFSSNAYQYSEELSCLNNPTQKFKCPPGWILESSKIDEPSGLYFEILKHKGDDKNKPSIVFAFRGSELSLNDWKSNARWFLRWFPHKDQYDIARTKVSDFLIGQFGESYCSQGINIYTTGHSLGGGIAQHIAYAFPCITAYVFDSSPVTGYYQLNPPFDATVVRIYEKGEILSYVRDLMKYFYPVSDNITELPQGVSFSKSPGKEHSMEALAAGMLKHAKNEDLKTIHSDYLLRTGLMRASKCK